MVEMNTLQHHHHLSSHGPLVQLPSKPLSSISMSRIDLHHNHNPHPKMLLNHHHLHDSNHKSPSSSSHLSIFSTNENGAKAARNLLHESSVSALHRNASTLISTSNSSEASTLVIPAASTKTAATIKTTTQQNNNNNNTHHAAVALTAAHPPVSSSLLDTTAADNTGNSSIPTTASSSLTAPPSPPSSTPTTTTPTTTPTTTTTKSFLQLRQKYLPELDYMLTEFQKLERQLLGSVKAPPPPPPPPTSPSAPPAATTMIEAVSSSSTTSSIIITHERESDGSRERREKLHSFIVHLQETLQQIQSGCARELEWREKEGTSSNHERVNEEEEEEDVEAIRKLEEHVLTNLLPVKVRLKKQLAAQQGAKHNPAGMPVRGTLLARSTQPPLLHHHTGRPTFGGAAVVEEEHRRHRQQEQERAAHACLEPPSSMMRAVVGSGERIVGGSDLTQKLHGLGVPAPGASLSTEHSTTTKILYAGLAIGSDQHESSIASASAIHKNVIKSKGVPERLNRDECSDMIRIRAVRDERDDEALGSGQMATPSLHWSGHPPIPIDESIAVEDHLRRLKKKRKRKKLREEQSMKEHETKKHSSNKRKKRGPWPVEYICSLCNEVYNSMSEYNPWWALQQQECPKCHKIQIPRIDINAPANAIEYHPALLAHAEENGGGGGCVGGGIGTTAVPGPMHMPSSHLSPLATFPTTTISKDLSEDSESTGSDLSDEDWESLLSDTSDADSCGSTTACLDQDALAALSPAEQAELERFGESYTGPKLTEREASRLLTLMAHASTCPCQHTSTQHREVCRSTKWMMLHVRDCPGTTSTFDVCPFPWCRKVKHLLYHLVTCQHPETCRICSPTLTQSNMNLKCLHYLNEHRFKRYREKLIAYILSNANDHSAKEDSVCIMIPPPSDSDTDRPVPDATKSKDDESELLAVSETTEKDTKPSLLPTDASHSEAPKVDGLETHLEDEMCVPDEAPSMSPLLSSMRPHDSMLQIKEPSSSTVDLLRFYDDAEHEHADDVDMAVFEDSLDSFLSSPCNKHIVGEERCVHVQE